MTTSALLGLPAPAKLNLFLHVTGRREDGKHLLESIFELIDLHDTIDLYSLDQDIVERTGDVIGSIEADLCMRAARLIKDLYGIHQGVRIHVTKRIPAGAGMGGGSSDAATTLIGLNRLFKLNLSRTQLMQLGEQLGADVPFFIFGQTGFVEGIGEQITPIEIPSARYSIIWPGIGISTAHIFNDPHLTRNTKSIKILVFSGAVRKAWPELIGHNDLQAVATKLEPRLKTSLEMLATCNSARMTGSGSAVFGLIPESTKYQLPDLPEQWIGFTVKSLSKHPLYQWLK